MVQSSVSVYGASPRDPAKFTEDLLPRVQPRTGFGKDSVEVECYVRGLARRRPDVVVTTLRLANLMGAGVDSQVTRYLSLPVVPRVLGFDARLQFLHPSDAVEALLLVTRDDVPGTFNVAAPDIVTLTQALRIMGRPSVGISNRLAPARGRLVRQARLSDFSADQIAALTYGRGMDTTRFTRRRPASPPRYSSRAALEEFAASRRPGALSPERVEAGAGSRSGTTWPAAVGEPWLTPRSSSWAAAVPPAGAAGRPVGRRPRSGRRAAARRTRPRPARPARRDRRPGRPARSRDTGRADFTHRRAPAEEVPPTLSLGALLELVRSCTGARRAGPASVRASFATSPPTRCAPLADLAGRSAWTGRDRSTRWWPSPGRG